MNATQIRQGVPIKTVREKIIRDNRRPYAFCTGFLTLLFVLFFVVNINGQGRLDLFVFLLFLGWAGYGIWFFTQRFTHYSFVAEDGFYIVDRGYAVHIPWEKIQYAEVIMSGYNSRYAHSSHMMRIYFQPDIVDEVTGTPVQIEEDRDDRFLYSSEILECFKRHVPVTAASA